MHPLLNRCAIYRVFRWKTQHIRYGLCRNTHLCTTYSNTRFLSEVGGAIHR
jgi:hypothetical protein